MKNHWLSLLTIGFLTVVTFIFFYIRLLPIEIPTFEDELALQNIEEPLITFINPSRGPATATVTIVEFGDFQCVACKDTAEVIEIVAKTFPNDVRVVWKHFPNESLHEQATPAAIAAQCASRQGRFWDFHDKLFERQHQLSDSLFEAIAIELELDKNRFNHCYRTRDTLPIIQKDFQEARALDLTATPSLYVGSELVVGAITVEELIAMVNEHLP